MRTVEVEDTSETAMVVELVVGMTLLLLGIIEVELVMEGVAGQLETLAVTVRGTPSTMDVPVWVIVVVEMSVMTCVEDK